jgi:hypothetical protein
MQYSFKFELCPDGDNGVLLKLLCSRVPPSQKVPLADLESRLVYHTIVCLLHGDLAASL